MPYYGDGAPYGFYAGGGGAFANHSSLMTGINRYHNPIAARYSPHLSTISESPFVTLRRFSPAVSTTTSHTTSLSRPRRIIDTADIDVSKPPRTLAQENRPQRHRLRRDRPTIKIRSQALKDNPALREYNERHEKTVGELLVEKFLIKDKGERKMKLYHQPSLMANDKESEELPKEKEKEKEILAAIRRRVTRRMTRRRSSADVLPLDPEQIEREAVLQAAQAEALDSLVAEEQAEIEVEVRRGTFAKRQAMRLPMEVSELSETEEDDELEDELEDGSKKHATTKKKKKRRKSLDKLSVKSDDEDELEIPESVIEEAEEAEEAEEFQWDDREKCDDVRAVLPVESEAKVSKKEPPVGKAEAKEKAEKPKDEPKLKPKDKKAREKTPNRLKRTVSAPQAKLEEDEPTARFKVEACNSVGDFSTLYVKAAAENSRSIEQFRESVSLPAPRQRAPASNIETEVLLPVRKPYVRDTSRNSVYLALKPSQAKKSDDGYNSSIITDEPPTNKESAAESRPAKCAAVVAADRSKIESASEPIIRAEGAQRQIERGAAVVVDDKKQEPGDRAIVKKSAGRGGEEFVSWWDESEEPAELEPKIEAAKSETKLAEKVPDKLQVAESVEAKLKPEPSELKTRVEVTDKSATVAKEKVSKPLEEQPKPQPVPKVEDAKNLTSNLVSASTPDKKPTSPVKKEVDSIPEKKATSPVKDSIKGVAPIPEKKSKKEFIDSVKEVASTPEKKSEKELIDSVRQVPSIPEKKPTSPVVKDAIKEVAAIPEKKPETPLVDSIKEVPSIAEKKPASPAKDSIKEVVPIPEKKSATPSTEEKKPASPIKDSLKEASTPKDTSKQVPAKILEKRPLSNNEIIKPKFDLPREHHLPRIPEEPKSASPEKQPSKPVEPLKKDKPKKKLDSEAIMKIEKKILEDSESPDKILTGAIPEPAVSPSPVTKKEPKVGLATEKKSDATAAQPEIDFWSEIRAEESSVKVTPKKVQSPVDEQLPHSRRHSPENLKLDLSKIRDDSAAPPEDLKTPLVEDLNRTPLVEEPSTPLVENLSEVPLENLQLENRVPNGEVQVPPEIVEQENKEEQPEERGGISGTVKKISKWANQDNLNEADKDATPLASKEVSPQASVASSTTKKKVVKRKKSSATPKKKASEKGESAKTKKAPVKKVAASPQTSQLKTAMSASGSPRNTPGQRPPDLMKMFYTTPAILLTATPRDLRKVRRAKVKRKKPPTRTPSLSSDSTGSTRSTATTSTEEGSNCEEDEERKRLASTRTPSQSSENQRNADGEHYHHSGRITPPATNLPRFKKYEVTDFNFLKVLGKGSFGKVLLAELRGTECVYAVKCLKKDVVLEDDDVECTLIERKVLTLATRHPYLCHLFCTFQTESHLFFVMEYLNGGDLMFHIQKSGRFSEQRAKFYAAEIWSGLIFLHKKGIVYRDLKLDNVLLDFEGHIRIADFGMCKLQIFLDRTADTFCGTPDYMAPEIIKGLKYNQAVDWWSFGVLLYEMLTGQSPFSGCDEDELFWSICNERPFIPRYLSQSATDILVCLLEKDAGKRIPGHEIACHPFFCTITWDKLERRSMEPPFKPAVEHTLDTRYFDTAFTTERPRLTPVPEQILTSMDQAVFRGFSYTNPNATD
ncbi:titin isoform X2 [Nasonia vitripennis]|uniref:Protein kinase C n=1 Tax=Nasonia vitripennis TaxID=7425 RepID=A0A7M7HDS7_NASVI|nr:titin isoform X2 [Nasonia vitripennis]